MNAPPWAMRSPAWLTNLGLVLFGLIFIELTGTGTQEFHRYIHGYGAGIFGQIILYLGAFALIDRSPGNEATNGATLPIVFAVALCARAVAVAADPFLSSDVYRYVWDGMVQGAGINPYRYVPADPHLDFLRDGAIYPLINRRDYAHTIYPPGAQFLFLVIAHLQQSIVFMKLAMVGFEAATCAVLMRCLRLLGQPRERVLLYAWHPVCLWEIGSSGHMDAMAVTAIALATLACIQGRQLRATGWVAAATLLKLYPVALLPAFVRRRVGAPLLLLAGIVVAGYVPYLSVGRGVFGFLSGYAKEEGVESGTRFFPLAWAARVLHLHIAPGVYMAGCAVGLLGLAWWAFRRGARGAACVSSGLLLATAMNLCFSPHYPWYFLWLVPFLTLWPWRPAFYLVLAITYLLSTRFGMPGEPLYQMNVRLYGGFFLLLGFDLLTRALPGRSMRSTGPSAQPALPLAESRPR